MSSDKKNKSVRQSILAAPDLKRKQCAIPEWDFVGFVQELDGETAFEIAQIAASGREDENENVYILEAYVCGGLLDNEGNRVFSLEDRRELAKKSPKIIERIYNLVTSLSGVTDDQVEAAAKK